MNTGPRHVNGAGSRTAIRSLRQRLNLISDVLIALNDQAVESCATAIGHITQALNADLGVLLNGSRVEVIVGLQAIAPDGLSQAALSQAETLRLDNGLELQVHWQHLGAGPILMIGRHQDSFNPEERQLLQTIAQAFELYFQTSQFLLEERRARHEAIEEARRDTLTGLPNRARAMEQLRHQLADAGGGSGAGPMAVLFIDLDNFKQINDAHGHAVGDHFLITVSKILLGLVEANDLVARLAGDEFIIITEESHDGEARKLADSIIAEISKPMLIGSIVLSHSASIGIAIAGAMDRAETLIENADLAMYQSKQLGRGRSTNFDHQLRTTAKTRAHLEEALKQAVINGQIRCHLQSIVSLPDHEIIGFEALARWYDPKRGLISPADFIPIAETSSLITEIDALIIHQACQTLAGWQAMGLAAGLHVSANLSARSLNDQRIASQIEASLASTGMPSDLLYIEITETMLVENLDTAARTLEKLRRLGIRLAIDDFGTGYSSLRYLKQLPVGFLKIDQSFISGLGENQQDDVIVAAVIRMAMALGLQVIAEGVETEDQSRLLSELGCHFAQGFLFGRPSDPSIMEKLLRDEMATRIGDPAQSRPA